MVIFDWIVLALTILFIVIYGAVKTSKSSNIKSFLKDNNNTNWFTIGVSVMATQASAITFLSTPGQAYNDGMGFLQFYLGLPIAMKTGGPDGINTLKRLNKRLLSSE